MLGSVYSHFFEAWAFCTGGYPDVQQLHKAARVVQFGTFCEGQLIYLIF